MAEDPAEPAGEGEEERLPWLQPTGEIVATKSSQSRLPLYFGLIVLVAALLVFVLLPRHHPRPDTEALDANLLSPEDQNLVGVAAQPAQPAPTTQPAVRRHRPHHRAAGAAGETTGTGTHAAAPATRPHRPAAPPRALPTRSAPAPIRRAERAPTRIAAPQRHAKVARGPVEIVQLGAFASRHGAERAWEKMEGRFAGDPHRIERARVRGRIFYRLRVEVAAARAGCGDWRQRHGRCTIVTGGR